MPRICCRIQKRHNKQGVSFKISEVENIIYKYNFENILDHPISTLIYLLPLNFQNYGYCGFSIKLWVEHVILNFFYNKKKTTFIWVTVLVCRWWFNHSYHTNDTYWTWLTVKSKPLRRCRHTTIISHLKQQFCGSFEVHDQEVKNPPRLTRPGLLVPFPVWVQAFK